MVFSSLIFLFVFLPINLLVYYIIPSRHWKNAVLIFSSLIFYAWGEPIWVSLLVISATVDYVHGRIAERYRGRWQSKAAVISSLIINLGLLGTFKYAGFIVETVNTLLNTTFREPGFALPIGISFYTFQTISYVVDVYRGEVKAQRSYAKFLMFVSLFHQLVAGPIVRYKDIAHDIETRVFNKDVFAYGIVRFVIGLAKKVLLANTAGEIAVLIIDGDFANQSMAAHWIGMMLYAFQIYFDFSGYSDMAIGLGRMFGFTYLENFNYPYISKSATEFWRRWHISLGSFFRDYVYIPLGGNRRMLLRNILVVWFLTGLWHGASWNFVLWGLYYGILILIEKQLKAYFFMERLPSFLGHIYLFVVTIFGWTLFYYEKLSEGISYMQGLVDVHHLWDAQAEIILMNNGFFILLALVCSTPALKKLMTGIGHAMERMHLGALYEGVLYPVGIAGLFVLSFIVLIGQSYNPFLYFRF